MKHSLSMEYDIDSLDANVVRRALQLLLSQDNSCVRDAARLAVRSALASLDGSAASHALKAATDECFKPANDVEDLGRSIGIWTFFCRHGYAKLDALLAAKELNAVSRMFESVFQLPEAWIFYPDTGRLCNNHTLTICPGVDAIIRHPRIIPIVRSILGEDVCCTACELCVMEPWEEQAPAVQRWHRDMPHEDQGPLRTHVVQAIWYFTDVDASTHCFSVSPEMASEPILDSMSAQLARSPGRDLHGCAGTCILFSASVVHCATLRPNAAQHRRTMIVCYRRRARPGQPLDSPDIKSIPAMSKELASEDPEFYPSSWWRRCDWPLAELQKLIKSPSPSLFSDLAIRKRRLPSAEFLGCKPLVLGDREVGPAVSALESAMPEQEASELMLAVCSKDNFEDLKGVHRLASAKADESGPLKVRLYFRNDGARTWPINTYLYQVIGPGSGSRTVVEALQNLQICEVGLTLPLMLEANGTSGCFQQRFAWCLTNPDGHAFGPLLLLDVSRAGNSAS